MGWDRRRWSLSGFGSSSCHKRCRRCRQPSALSMLSPSAAWRLLKRRTHRGSGQPLLATYDLCRPADRGRTMTAKGSPPCPTTTESLVSTELLDKRESRIRGMFGAIAPSYDLLNHLLSLNIDQAWRRRTTRLVPPLTSPPPHPPAPSPTRGEGELVGSPLSPEWERGGGGVRGGAPILDVCTGTGDLALAYDRAARRRVPIVGADFCHEMLVRAVAKTKKRHAGQ